MGGIRVLVGEYDGTKHAAAMVNDSSGWMIGPLWEGADARGQIDGFLEWLRTMRFVNRSEEIGLTPNDVPGHRGDGDDPRHWPDSGLEKLVAYWRREHLDEDGLLKEPAAAS